MASALVSSLLHEHIGSLTIIDKLLADPESSSCLSALIASFRRILAVPPTPTIFFAAGQTPQPVLSEQNLLPLFRGTEAELCRSCGSFIPHGPHYFHKLDPAHPLLMELGACKPSATAAGTLG